MAADVTQKALGRDALLSDTSPPVSALWHRQGEIPWYRGASLGASKWCPSQC